MFLEKKNPPERIRLSRGLCGAAAQMFSTSVETISRLWKKYKKFGLESALSRKKEKKAGRPQSVIDMEALKKIPIKKRGTVRCTAKQLGIPKSTLQNHIKYGHIKVVRSAVKPKLTDGNKLQRVRYCLDKLIPDPASAIANFQPDFNTIHVDEKWFFQTSVVRNVLMAPDEEAPHRQTQSKRFITKIMFMCAVARPRPEVDFDGKIGIWAFKKVEAAQRNSKNHRRGDLVTKPENVDKDTYREMLLNNVLPAILAHFPDTEATVVIQQDNAGPHIDPDDPDWADAVAQTGWNISLKFQPPNSPDLNVNDLGFFRSIQSIAQEECPDNIEELVQSVEAAFAGYSSKDLNKIWLSHQQAMIETLLHKGNNNYKLAHMKKEKLIRENKLPISLHVDMTLYDECVQFLRDSELVIV